MSRAWWWAAFLAITATLACALVTGSSNLTLGAALVATGVTFIAVLVEKPPRGDGRPW